MYVLPKGLESTWVMERGEGWVFRTGKWDETLLTLAIWDGYGALLLYFSCH